jgi:hypothetical protein
MQSGFSGKTKSDLELRREIREWEETDGCNMYLKKGKIKFHISSKAEKIVRVPFWGHHIREGKMA